MYRRAVNLMEADIGDELVALDAERGECFGFNEVATVVWRHLEQPRSLAELRSALLDEYDVTGEQCDEELGNLLDDLVAKGLVARTDDDGTTSNNEHFC